MDFEWDTAKAASNLHKHGVAFEYATRVFLDPRRLDSEDPRDDYGEERRITVGWIEGSLFVVAYTERGGATRLISARKATTREHQSYSDAIQT